MTADTRMAEIRQRLDAAKAEQPYEVIDRHEVTAKAWSDLYEHAPDDLDWTTGRIKELEALLTAAHDTIRRLDQQHDEAIDSIHEMQTRLDAVWQVVKPGPHECGGCPPEGWTSEAWNARLDTLAEVRRAYTDGGPIRIEDAGQLDALPEGSVVLGRSGKAWQSENLIPGSPLWYTLDYGAPAAVVVEHDAPLTLLHRGGGTDG